jgi:hypothetical protein
MGANLFSFSQFSCEKLKRFAPSEAISGFSDGVTTRYYIVFLSVLSLSIYYYQNAALKKIRATYLYRMITWRQWHPTPPSKIMPKHDKDSGDIGKKNITK